MKNTAPARYRSNSTSVILGCASENLAKLHGDLPQPDPITYAERAIHSIAIVLGQVLEFGLQHGDAVPQHHACASTLLALIHEAREALAADDAHATVGLGARVAQLHSDYFHWK